MKKVLIASSVSLVSTAVAYYFYNNWRYKQAMGNDFELVEKFILCNISDNAKELQTLKANNPRSCIALGLLDLNSVVHVAYLEQEYENRSADENLILQILKLAVEEGLLHDSVHSLAVSDMGVVAAALHLIAESISSILNEQKKNSLIQIQHVLVSLLVQSKFSSSILKSFACLKKPSASMQDLQDAFQHSNKNIIAYLQLIQNHVPIAEKETLLLQKYKQSFSHSFALARQIESTMREQGKYKNAIEFLTSAIKSGELIQEHGEVLHSLRNDNWILNGEIQVALETMKQKLQEKNWTIYTEEYLYLRFCLLELQGLSEEILSYKCNQYSTNIYYCVFTPYYEALQILFSGAPDLREAVLKTCKNSTQLVTLLRENANLKKQVEAVSLANVHSNLNKRYENAMGAALILQMINKPRNGKIFVQELPRAAGEMVRGAAKDKKNLNNFYNCIEYVCEHY